MQFTAFLSVNLGLINIVPFPALDGGRLFFLLIEGIRGGRRIRPEIENAIHSFGFLILLALIFMVTYRDVLKLF
jgi:regulator of sigma E protease